MAQYFFDITDGNHLADTVGMDLFSLDAVRAHAIGLSGALLNSNSPAFWRGEEWLIEARDDIGVVLFTLAFRASDRPVTRERARVA